MRSISFYKPLCMDVPKLTSRIQSILNNGQFSNGRYCRALENKLNDMYGSKYALLMPSGTSALHASAQFLMRLRKTKFLATQSFTDKSHICLSPSHLIKTDTQTWGAQFNSQNEPMVTVFTEPFGSITSPNYIKTHTIMDMAHCIGVNAHEGVFARILSFAPSKLVTMGEGGCILTDSGELNDFVTQNRNLFRPTEIGAAMAIHQLSRLKQILARRREIAENYIDAFGDQFQFQTIPFRTNWSRVGCLAKTAAERNRIAKALEGSVELRQYYQPIYPDPVAQDIYDRMLVLPSYHDVDEQEVIRRIKAVL